MNKKLQVFVSSTYTDLIEERQAAVEAILDAGHIPAGMELFKAGKSQMQTIQKWIDESDVYMLILGGRYGSIENESGLSYTELEYRYAISKNMPVFSIVLSDKFLYTKAASMGKKAIFETENQIFYEEFKSFVTTNIVKFPDNIDHISTIIHAQLNDLLINPQIDLIGWTRDLIGASNSYGLFPTKIFGKYLISVCEMLEDAITRNSHSIYDFALKIHINPKELCDALSGEIRLTEKNYHNIMYELNLPSLEEKLFNYAYDMYNKWYGLP